MKANILVVDDMPENLRLLMEILREQGYKVRPAANGPRALSTAQVDLPDLILLDIIMPGMDGYEVCKQLKADKRTCDIPVIFISGLNEIFDKVKAFSTGGVDYITKPFQPAEVLARVQTHLRIRQLQRQLQEQNIELEEQNGRFRALSEATFEGIIIHANRRVVDVNQRVEKMFNYSHSELIGKPVPDFITPECRDTVAARMRTGDEHPYEAQGLRKDGSVFPVEIQAKTMPYKGHQARVTAVRDLSWQKAMEARNEQLSRENITLKASMKDRYRFGDLIGRSPVMQEVYELISKASATDANVVIYGESGTGKDLIAQTIHKLSKRRKHPFIPVNCGSIQETLFESEFFGHRKGAFTGAVRDKPGFFDAAHKGILFLDEIGELPLTMQVKLLRAIEGKGYTPVGDQRVKHADVRIIAATNRNLKEQITQGLFRKDFFYRINVIMINVPPLRERKEDIPLLVEHFLKQYGKHPPDPPQGRKHPPGPPQGGNHDQPQVLPGRILELLYNRDWPGNIRQLQNALQRYLTFKRLDFDDDLHEMKNEVSHQTIAQGRMELREVVEEFEKHVIVKTLEQNQGHRQKTAAMLGIPLRTLYKKLRKYGLTKDTE